MKEMIYVFIGGGSGSLLRYLISTILNVGSYPHGTLAVNIIGSLIIGILSQLDFITMDSRLKLILITGFCGGFTTYSTFVLDHFNLSKDSLLLSGGYIIITLVVGYIALFLGIKLGTFLH